MATSADRILEIRAALNSTGKSIKAYSKRFAAGEAPEQSGDGARTSGGLDSSSVREDEIKELLVNLTALTKDLHGRSVGRNADDVDVLVRLGATWDDVRRAQAAEVAEIRATADEKAAANNAAEVQRQVAAAAGVPSGGGVAAVKAAEARAAEAEAAAAAAKAEAEAEAYKAAAEEVKAEEEAAKGASARERAAAAEAQVAELEAKVADLEAQLAATRTFDAAATVEEQGAPPSPGAAPVKEAELLLARSITGACVLGSTLRLNGVQGVPAATFQWHRLGKAPGGAPAGAEPEPIGGATRAQYAPEPRDLGVVLSCAITPFLGGPVITVTTPGPVADMDGLASALSSSLAKESCEFNCVVVQRNGEMQDRREVHQLEVLPDRVKLKLKGKTRHKESYSEGMQVCGARGGGDAAAQGLFLALSPSLVFMLACESAKQRNTAILLIRARALERGFQVLGPKDR